MNTIEIVIENLGERRYVEQGTTLAELVRLLDGPLLEQTGGNPILGALVNNKVETLQYRIYNPRTIEFFDIRNRHGKRMFQNSLGFMMYKAVKDTYPGAQLHFDHSLLNGTYCRIENLDVDHATVCKNVSHRMSQIQEQDLPFSSKLMLKEDALKMISQEDLPETYRLLESLKQLYIELQFIDHTVHTTAAPLVPSTGCLTGWTLELFEDGYLLNMPEPEIKYHFDKADKLFNVFQEHHSWVKLLRIPTITDLNTIIRAGGTNQLVQVAEALHEKKYAEIAEEIHNRRDKVRLILLAGPSSSGKTTSCRRLSVQLNVLGHDVKQISLDDYFVSRDRTPKLPNGEYDFESVDALDIPLLNDHLKRLFNDEEVEIPTFDFIKGDPYFSGKKLSLKPKKLLIIEGIHALNPKLTAQIPEEMKFKVYVSALTQVAIDDQNIIHSSDNRLIRRIVRDNNFRGWNAYETLKRWDNVQAGERKHIFPYQENADMMFNSALFYELALLKTFAEPLLKQVPENCKEYAEACRLLNFIELIEPIDPKHVPPTSIMREFLGGSSFEY